METMMMIGLIFNAPPMILGPITFPSICCKTNKARRIVIALLSPPVNNVTNPVISDATIEPKYGIILQIPKSNPNVMAYFI